MPPTRAVARPAARRARRRRDDGQRRLERRPQLAVRDVLHARVLDRPLDDAADRAGVASSLAQEHGVVLRRRARDRARASRR